MQPTDESASGGGEVVPRWDPRRNLFVRAFVLDGRVVERRLTELFSGADALADVDGETPGEKVAVIEFLLALCYASGTYPVSDEEWRRWVREERPLGEVASWLEEQLDEDWNLFSATRPLSQNALLGEFLEGHGTGPAQLVIERAGDYNQFADHHHLEHPDPLPAAKAYRAVLTQHVFGVPGRARVSGKETLGPAITNLSAGRLGGRVRVLALGRTLGQTLRLNLTPTAEDPRVLNLTWTEGPIGRRGFEARPKPRPVEGYADLHSYLGRSVLLRPKAGLSGDRAVVDRVLIGAGELLDLDDEKHLQDAVRSETRDGVSKPLWPSPTRDLWREAHALYAAVESRSGGLYERLAQLPKEEGTARRPFDLLAVGLVANKSSPIGWVASVFPFAPGQAPALYAASLRGSRVAEHIARALDHAAFKAWAVMFPNPKPADKKAQIARFDARGMQWKATEQPFHTLLADVADGAKVDDCMPGYTLWLVESARELLDKCLDSLPRNGQGLRARAAAHRGFTRFLTGPKAPDDLGVVPNGDA
ncbi:type I-E CRISPR-associated protein Cse1/CasA [Actinomadura harenae]|uniref:Type I-E CRISPR-associated protein Cse1/CasA n=1 Tax=Actinomadura harenae TaxID=2483351 RepID=A0A3M2MBG2_9ACTN|nr:type I-E CRISPR-associated protein Cse1/CasA [Actinomadura harenae]RMI44518.1 type I-E CRISPR-associated protein Cse1/CasA [Actinomadura harenae]